MKAELTRKLKAVNADSKTEKNLLNKKRTLYVIVEQKKKSKLKPKLIKEREK